MRIQYSVLLNTEKKNRFSFNFLADLKHVNKVVVGHIKIRTTVSEQTLTSKQDHAKTDPMHSNQGIYKSIILHHMIGAVYSCIGKCLL